MKRVLDWQAYLNIAAETVAEGVVMLKNEGNALPLSKSETVAVFGRIQFHYYKSGTGSGGMVNVSKVTGITDGLLECGMKLHEGVLETYRQWDEQHPFDMGDGWGAEPWSQVEMPLEESLVQQAAADCKKAIVVIGRTAGEEQDNKNEPGAYLLSEGEQAMLEAVSRHFQQVIVLLNVGNIIDMKAIEACNPAAILYVWQGGMTGGTGTAAVLTGEVSPSGKLPDTIAESVTDYPSDANFGDSEKNIYAEDIFVGYRYFETFAPETVLYPFGYGLSYTTFDIQKTGVSIEKNDDFTIKFSVTNTGNYAGKEVVQLYFEAPQGLLGKAKRVLCGFCKTKTLAPNETQHMSLTVPLEALASYDDDGRTGHAFCYVIECGEYYFYLGSDVRSASLVHIHGFEDETAWKIRQCQQVLAPVEPFERFHAKWSAPRSAQLVMEAAPLSQVDEPARRLEHLPQELPCTGDKGIKLADVKNGKATMEAFVGQFSDNDLACIVRGEGMGSPRVTAGTASAFGGVAKHLEEMGIPAVCCSDGPSGMRLDCGTKAFSLPNGTMIASTFNEELIEQLFTFMGKEMEANHVECLLGPGMNIHRHPLNGRNFEYFSEDPFLTGKMAAAELRGLHSVGVTGTIKHFCGNNQEAYRHFTDAVVSERALREIYLKGFEIAVKEGNADSVMTTYGKVNGLWTASSYDLNTVILREEWGFDGVVMTDWWSSMNERGVEGYSKNNFAAMVMAQNDMYMVCASGEENDDNTLESLASGKLKRSELQRCAMNICRFVMNTKAQERMGEDYQPMKVINKPEEDMDSDEPVQFYDMDESLTLPLDEICTDKGKSHSFALIVNKPGFYTVTLTASSTQGELAQIPVTLFSMGTASGTFTWNGTGGKPVSFGKDIPMFSKFTSIRLYFAQSGLNMHSIRFDLTDFPVSTDELVKE